jgi:MFS family permease
MQPYPRRWQALAVLAFSLLVITMGNTILNVGLPTIQEELDASSSQLQWIVDSYLLVFAGLLLAAGSLRDRFSRKHALLSGLVVFGLGSGFAALATDATTLIASRAVMGLGAAGIMPTTLSTLTTSSQPTSGRRRSPPGPRSRHRHRGRPISSGFLIEHFDWSSIFLINLPVVAMCLLGAWVLVPNSRDPESPKLDLVGTGLSIAGLSAVVWGLIEAPERGWRSPSIMAAFAPARRSSRRSWPGSVAPITRCST